MSDASMWRSAIGDIPIRLMIVRKTREIFEEIQLPCEPEVFEETLTALVPRLEAELYRTATSLEEYGDPRTVKERLERMAPPQAHVRPLEAIWLQGLWIQGLFNNQGTINAAPSEATQQPAPCCEPSPSTISPQTTPLNRLEALRVPAFRQVQDTDGFTRSLRELRQYLERYDTLANSIVIVTPSTSAILLPEDFDHLQRHSAPSALDLKCYESLGENP